MSDEEILNKYLEIFNANTLSVSLEELLEYRKERFEKSSSLVSKKGADYNRKQQKEGDTLFNLKICELIGIVPTAERGILVRVSDKFMRLISLVDINEVNAVKNESFEDTIDDIHNYIDYLAIIRKKRLELK
jgi:hypothetical protein